ncbi:MAG: exosortase K [Acidobacteria bacterium]|nr:MAG: exosortase K [Acidobacteriota bacterium]
MRIFRSRKSYQSAAVITAAALLKLFYSTANVNELRWILAPTSFCVELVTGETFWFESYAGYINNDNSFLIADSCSGMNFLIAAFLMLSVLVLWGENNVDVAWYAFPIVAAAAFFTTIAANTVRIAVALKLHRMNAAALWINPEQAHRLQGIFIYFGFLLLLYFLYEKLDRSHQVETAKLTTLIRRPLIPLLIYWLITLGIPIIRGSYQEGSPFWEHLTFVVLTPLILITPFVVIDQLKRRRSTLVNEQ